MASKTGHISSATLLCRKESAIAGSWARFDQCFGTAINRFCAQAVVDLPLTPFGKGLQKRGFLPLRDSMQCLGLALENPAEAGEYRVFNQFEEVYGVTELAERVQRIAADFELDVKIHPIENPRMEAESHYYNPDHQKLLDLGYQPTRDMDAEIQQVFRDLLANKDRIEARKESLFPDIHGTERDASPTISNSGPDSGPDSGLGLWSFFYTRSGG